MNDIWLLAFSLAQIVLAAAVIVYLIRRSARRPCRHCGKRMQRASTVCEHCGHHQGKRA